MKIKSGTKVRVMHKRKGIFVGYASEDFDTETTEFYPIKAAHFVDGISDDWDEGEIVPCRNILCKIEVLGGRMKCR